MTCLPRSRLMGEPGSEQVSPLLALWVSPAELPSFRAFSRGPGDPWLVAGQSCRRLLALGLWGQLW